MKNLPLDGRFSVNLTTGITLTFATTLTTSTFTAALTTFTFAATFTTLTLTAPTFATAFTTLTTRWWRWRIEPVYKAGIPIGITDLCFQFPTFSLGDSDGDAVFLGISLPSFTGGGQLPHGVVVFSHLGEAKPRK